MRRQADFLDIFTGGQAIVHIHKTITIPGTGFFLQRVINNAIIVHMD